ncbi:MAG: hypothetical protein R3C19_03565 [Planctomycetaceae bacterium]
MTPVLEPVCRSPKKDSELPDVLFPVDASRIAEVSPVQEWREECTACEVEANDPADATGSDRMQYPVCMWRYPHGADCQKDGIESAGSIRKEVLKSDERCGNHQQIAARERKDAWDPEQEEGAEVSDCAWNELCISTYWEKHRYAEKYPGRGERAPENDPKGSWNRIDCRARAHLGHGKLKTKEPAGFGTLYRVACRRESAKIRRHRDLREAWCACTWFHLAVLRMLRKTTAISIEYVGDGKTVC